MKDALQLLEKSASGRKIEVFVIGGEEIYRQALPFASRIYLTLVETEIQGDAFFPNWDVDAFELISISRKDEASEALPYSFLELARISDSEVKKSLQ